MDLLEVVWIVELRGIDEIEKNEEVLIQTNCQLLKGKRVKVGMSSKSLKCE